VNTGHSVSLIAFSLSYNFAAVDVVVAADVLPAVPSHDSGRALQRRADPGR